MRTILFVSTLLIAQLCFAQKSPVEVAGGHQVEIQTSAICFMCKEAIEYELTFTKGVKEADLDLDNKVITVKYNPKKVSADEIRNSIAKVGYHADNVQRDSLAYDKLPFCCKDGGGHGDHSSH